MYENYGQFINGVWRQGQGAETIVVTDPGRNEKLGEIRGLHNRTHWMPSPVLRLHCRCGNNFPPGTVPAHCTGWQLRWNRCVNRPR
ncbi:hypothetical protein ABMA09_12260 [Erwinia rhapontici]|nr:hypothetical protein ERHA55_26530 [Erwinia rhapontici]